MKRSPLALCARALPLVAVGLLAGCATPSGGTAVDVNGRTVSMTQVDDSTTGCASLLQRDASTLRPQVAQMLLEGQAATEIAHREGFEVTPAMRAEALKQLQAEQLLANPQCATAVNALGDYGAVALKLKSQRLAAATQALDIQVNPRLGGWDRENGSITGASGSLSREDLGQGQVFGG